jgi:hypothetical protein
MQHDNDNDVVVIYNFHPRCNFCWMMLETLESLNPSHAVLEFSPSQIFRQQTSESRGRPMGIDIAAILSALAGPGGTVAGQCTRLLSQKVPPKKTKMHA